MSDEKPKTEFIKLDGTIIKSDGSQYKSNFFKYLELNPDDYSDIVYTPEQARKIRMHLMYMSTGASASVPMICGGAAKCPVAKANRCPYVKEDAIAKKKDPTAKPITPVGRVCPIEWNLLNEYTRFYIQEYDVPEGAFTEIQMCRELAEIEMLLHRINSSLAMPEQADMTQMDVTGVDREGNVLTRRTVSSLFEIKERYQNRKSKLIKLMVGDRQEKYKKEAALKQRTETDPSSSSAQLRSRLQKMLSEAKQVDLQLKAAEGNVLAVEGTGEQTGVKALSPEDLIDGSD
jgi:hypothetical protein